MIKVIHDQFKTCSSYQLEITGTNIGVSSQNGLEIWYKMNKMDTFFQSTNPAFVTTLAESLTTHAACPSPHIWIGSRCYYVMNSLPVPWNDGNCLILTVEHDDGILAEFDARDVSMTTCNDIIIMNGLQRTAVFHKEFPSYSLFGYKRKLPVPCLSYDHEMSDKIRKDERKDELTDGQLAVLIFARL